MFGFNKSKEVKKYCERCGGLVISPYYSVIFSILYSIDGTNSQISKVDRNNQIAILSNGQRLEYTFEVEPNLFAYAENATEHLLCSEGCEDKFLQEYSSVFVRGQHPIYNFKQMNVFNPIAIPSSRIGGENRKCEYCNQQYKSNGRNWTKIPVISTTKINGTFNQRPNINLMKYKLVLSGLSQKQQNGDWYGYETANDKAKKVNYCSYDCAYEVVKNENVFILVNSIMDKERLGAIVKETELFNKMLGNPIHRPSFFQPIPS